MSWGDLFSTLSTLQLPVIGAVTPEMMLFALSIAFFGFSAGLCALALRAANAANRAHYDAATMAQASQNYASEMRAMLAENNNRSDVEPYQGEAASLSDRINSVDVTAQHGDEHTAAYDEEATARVVEATRAASEPRSLLLSGVLRRRR